MQECMQLQGKIALLLLVLIKEYKCIPPHKRTRNLLDDTPQNAGIVGLPRERRVVCSIVKGIHLNDHALWTSSS